MLDYITQLRNSKAQELMFAADQENDDPLADSPSAQGAAEGVPPPFKRAKRILIDELPSLIDLEVHTDTDEVATIKVVPTANDRAKLMVEPTDGAMN
eukprot:1958523-Pyramimonas_sp.AAC.1